MLPCEPFVRIFCFLGLSFFRDLSSSTARSAYDVGGCDAQRSAEAVQKGTPGTDVKLGRENMRGCLSLMYSLPKSTQERHAGCGACCFDPKFSRHDVHSKTDKQTNSFLLSASATGSLPLMGVSYANLPSLGGICSLLLLVGLYFILLPLTALSVGRSGAAGYLS